MRTNGWPAPTLTFATALIYPDHRLGELLPGADGGLHYHGSPSAGTLILFDTITAGDCKGLPAACLWPLLPQSPATPNPYTATTDSPPVSPASPPPSAHGDQAPRRYPGH